MKLLLLFPLFLVACLPAEEVTKEAPSFKGQHVNYYITDDDRVKGYLSIPGGEGPHPAVLLIHEWWGLNDQIRYQADAFAEAGYVALAVDLYHGEHTENATVARRLANRVREHQGKAFENLKAAMRYLRKQSVVDKGRLASVGWCFGGGWSYEIAKNDLGVKASVIYYGRFNPDDDLSKMRATIQGHFGKQDRSIPVDDVKAFQAVLETQSGEHQIFIYEHAGHAFANEQSSHYHRESATKAWERTMEFLEGEL